MDLYRNLEFDTILDNVAALSVAQPVHDAVKATEPSTDLYAVNKLLTQTGDAITVLASHRPNLFFEDISGLLSKVKVGAVLSPGELLKIKNCISSLRSVKNCIENTDGCDSLKDITAYARICDELEHLIDITVENETDIKDGASEKLYGLRRAIVRANARLKEKLDGYTRQSDISKYLQDNIVTVRGGRYVLPVRSDSKAHVKGLVHDVSSTGSTVFIEPFAVVEANNEIITLKTEEQNEIERILIALSAAVEKKLDELAVGQEILTTCGVIFAKAEYAKQLNAYKPTVNEDGRIVLNGARHPLIDRQSVVPVDIVLDKKRILLISGPNTGGKTVALKTVGLFALMAASGMFIPAADGSEIGLFDKIYCDIGDSQSIAQSLSTFSAHVTNLSFITSRMDEKSLVLLDEVGDGTDPDEGAALAIAIIKKISAMRSVAVVTTHFNAVKEFALGYADVGNACMQFDNVNFKPTYKLLQGVSGSSYALEIAEKLGLGKDIISDAKAALSVEKASFDRIMREAEKLRNDTMAEKERCEKLRVEAQVYAEKTEKLKREYEVKLADLNENARNIIKRRADEYSDKAEAIIDEIKENLKSASEQALFAARKTAKRLRDGVPSDEIKPELSDAPVTPDVIKPGVAVFIAGLNREGVVVGAPRGNKAMVAVGSIKTEMPLSSLSLVKKNEEKNKVRLEKRNSEPESREIMMLGKTVDEATAQLDLILYDIPSGSTLRIVHGKGTGALGKGIQAYLKRQSRVKSFRYGRYGEGDTGVTIAEIK